MKDDKNPDWVPNQKLGYVSIVAIKKKGAITRHHRHEKRFKVLDVSI